MQPTMVEITIRDFKPGDEVAFRRLNKEWITRYFTMEPKDEQTLDDPRAYILNRGGRIFLAFARDEAVGCVALIAMRSREFEVAKMAVTENWQGRGIGRRLMERAIEGARATRATKLVLETNDRMKPAIALYESVGFRHVPATEPSPYARSNVNMEMDL
jgi:GNAT superfamily N-acetyltransferase